MNYVTVVNRSSKPLEAIWDGVRYQIPVGESSLPERIAEVARRQNPQMGTEDPYSMRVTSLIAIKEQGDDIFPLEQSKSIERLDRASFPSNHPTEIVRGNTGVARHEVERPLPLNNAFVDPNE